MLLLLLLQERADEQQLEAAADAEQHLTAARQAVVGLSNLGNTCFFNSSVQLLLSCAPLQQMVLRKDSDITRGPLGFALQQAALHADGGSCAEQHQRCLQLAGVLAWWDVVVAVCHNSPYTGRGQQQLH